ncbi:heat shock 70 kDa protein 12A-like isoform X2 [Dreissena polymorpha]|uniref:heat shock 70 kDa protein 12A-like isoform X2 n=1 Tax=Dreissena polymorpha TaxID=45954 RepID=UPI002264D0F7|nr:heat shock 70 kDa protein 12A-like isoform X2 [Dreissena polymorpha]
MGGKSSKAEDKRNKKPVPTITASRTKKTLTENVPTQASNDDGAFGVRRFRRKSISDLEPDLVDRSDNTTIMSKAAPIQAYKPIRHKHIKNDDGAVGGRSLGSKSKSDLDPESRLSFDDDIFHSTRKDSLGGLYFHDDVWPITKHKQAQGMDKLNADTTVITIKSKREKALVCVSIDFGTTYSGYAYSFKSSPNDIIGRGGGQQIKTPTIVLLDPQKNMVAFGDKATNKYLQLVKNKQHTSWYMFERFKMALFVRDGPLDKDIIIEDIMGKKMRAIDIFSLAINFIKTEVLNTLTDKEHMKDIDINSENDLQWVLTVPAIWNDLSKKFMRDAATKAGIPDEMLTLALEPEAASLYCKEQLGISKLPSGHRYMVADLGGGTADITVHEVNHDGTLSEIHQPTGGDFGGTNVDNKFINTLVQIFGADLFQKFKQNCTDEYIDFMQSFETKKRHFNSTSRMTIRFPVKLREMYEMDIGEKVETTLAQTPFARNLEFKNDKLIISVDLAKSFFDEAIDKIDKSISDLLKKVKPLNHILLVGGFSESPYLQSVLRNTFGNMVIIPEEPSSAVLRGAVMYGHKPLAIAARVCKYTYGIARMMKFKQHHPPNKKIEIDGMAYCDDIFDKHIEIGTKMSVANAEHVTAHEYFPTMSEMRQAVLEVYASPKRNPKYVDEDGCQLVGLIKVDIDPQGDIYAKILVKLMFGGTELRIQVTDVKQNIVTNANFDFLG